MDRRRAYLDSSVALRVLLRAPDSLKNLSRWDLVTSDLLEVEVRRVLHRLSLDRALTAEHLALRIGELHLLLSAVDQVPISKAILNRAGGPMPTPVKTLDAIHLATALTWSEYHGVEVLFLTHDRQLATAARACGLTAYP
jgi:predicted nucleic acid-binding protein